MQTCQTTMCTTEMERWGWQVGGKPGPPGKLNPGKVSGRWKRVTLDGCQGVLLCSGSSSCMWRGRGQEGPRDFIGARERSKGAGRRGGQRRIRPDSSQDGSGLGYITGCSAWSVDRPLSHHTLPLPLNRDQGVRDDEGQVRINKAVNSPGSSSLYITTSGFHICSSQLNSLLYTSYSNCCSTLSVPCQFLPLVLTHFHTCGTSTFSGFPIPFPCIFQTSVFFSIPCCAHHSLIHCPSSHL